jgi:hypothetical protein
VKIAFALRKAYSVEGAGFLLSDSKATSVLRIDAAEYLASDL